MNRRQGLYAVVALGAAALGAGLAWRRQQGPNPAPAAPTAPVAAAAGAVGNLWALNFERPEGGELAMASLRGKPLLINFWATWCAPCVRELPEIDRFHRNHAARGIQVVGLAVDGPTPVREFLGRVKLGFPVGLAGLDGTELVHQLGNVQGGLPFSVLVNAAGQVVQRKMGETHYDELAGWAGQL